MDYSQQQRIRSAAMLADQARQELDAASRRRAPKLQVAKAMLQMATDGLEGQEREYAQETARDTEGGYNPHQMHVRWSDLGVGRRDVFASTDSAGGYMVGVDVPVVVDILRPFSAVVRAGVSTLTGLNGDTVLPHTSTVSTVAWMSSETAAATPADPVIAGTVMVPKIAIGVTQASRHFMRQAGDPEAYIRRELQRTAGGIVDKAVLVGSASGGEPRGLVNLSAISTEVGTSLAWADLAAMKYNAAAVNADEAQIAFIGHPDVRKLLEVREKASGSGFIWDGGKIANCSAYTSTHLAAASLLSGPFDRCYLGIWGDGILIEANPYDPTLFKSGIVQWRVIVGVDVAIACPATAFTKSTSIT